MRKKRVSLLHLAPRTGQIEHNRQLLESALEVAAREGADWVVTPELWVSGYLFMKEIGTDWILPQPDEWMQRICRLAQQRQLNLFLSHPERDPESGNMYNTCFVIDSCGEIVGKHSKIKALRGAEAWSTPGRHIAPIVCDQVPVGVLVCADAYKNEVAQELKDQGARLLVSPVSWGPGQCAPDGEWEQRTRDTGLPIMVCNRSGIEEEELDYRLAESVVARDGQRLLEAVSDRSVVLSFDWDLDAMTALSPEFQRSYL